MATHRDTTYLQRFGDALTLLCAGHRPPEPMLVDWLNIKGDGSLLQGFVGEHAPSWAQAVGVIDAALVMADNPTEGQSHESREEFTRARFGR